MIETLAYNLVFAGWYPNKSYKLNNSIGGLREFYKPLQSCALDKGSLSNERVKSGDVLI